MHSRDQSSYWRIFSWHGKGVHVEWTKWECTTREITSNEGYKGGFYYYKIGKNLSKKHPLKHMIAIEDVLT